MSRRNSSPLMPFIGELRRRKVLHVALVYAAVGYATVEIADVFLPALHLPGWILTAVAALVLLGFPIALVLAWALEVTPQGVRRTRGRASSANRQAKHGLPNLRTIGIAAGFLAAGALIGAWFGRAPADLLGGDGQLSSIAVLPFANLASGDDTRPFVDGIHDDLLTKLSRIHTLRVISRTSVLGYENTTKNIRDIATELGVGHVLEGGVQRSGSQVRINVQLIDGRTDEHVWAETYDRTLTVDNIFAIQSEIADAITQALRTNLTAEERRVIDARPTASLEAYDRYQLGMSHFRRSLDLEGVQAAVREFDEAVRLDPDFADAWARLAIAEATLSWEWLRHDALPRAERAASRAAQLAPDALLTHLAAGYIHYYGYRQYDEALEDYRRALALAPNDPEVLQPIGWVLRRQGEWQEALRHFERALERDPLHFELLFSSMGLSNMRLRNFGEARRHLEKAAALNPEDVRPALYLARITLMESGDTAAAASVLRRWAGASASFESLALAGSELARSLARSHGEALLAARDVNRSVNQGDVARSMGRDDVARMFYDSARVLLEPMIGADTIGTSGYTGRRLMGLARAYAGLGRDDEAVALARRSLERLLEHGDRFQEPGRRYDLAVVYVMVGEHELALDELERLLDARDGTLTSPLIAADPVWDPLRRHARYREMVARN